MIRSGERILLIGTGLTRMDIALDLVERDIAFPLLAISRHGLLPQPHLPDLVPTPPSLRSGGGTTAIRSYLRTVREQIRLHQGNGGDWRDVLAALRAMTPRLWQVLSQDERARFLRHLRPQGLGVATDERGALIGADGEPSSRLFLLGPLLKGRDWEFTAVPELREHAARLARHLSE